MTDDSKWREARVLESQEEGEFSFDRFAVVLKEQEALDSALGDLEEARFTFGGDEESGDAPVVKVLFSDGTRACGVWTNAELAFLLAGYFGAMVLGLGESAVAMLKPGAVAERNWRCEWRDLTDAPDWIRTVPAVATL